MSCLATHVHELKKKKKKKKNHKVVSNYKYLYMTAILENIKLTLFAFFSASEFLSSFCIYSYISKNKAGLTNHVNHSTQ